jgi:hypothetical protein
VRTHSDLLRDLFGEHLGPPGERGEWLPCGLATGSRSRSPAQQWCLLPTRRSVAVRPEWLAWNAGTIPRLAQEVYEEVALVGGHLDVVRLAVLADALEEAGCTDVALLEHLRGPGPHYQGCFAVDLLLGKG